MTKIDPTETKDSLFGGLSKTQQISKAVDEKLEQKTLENTDSQTAQHEKNKERDSFEEKPKWITLDKVTVLLTTEQKEGLDRVAKKIMKYRSSELKGNDEKERITANTLMRVLIDNFLEKENRLPMEVITNEETAKEWIKKLFYS